MPERYRPELQRRFRAPLVVFMYLLALCAEAAALSHSELWISEVMLNPPGTNNVPHQYVELRGTPNLLLTNAYLVAVEGDTNGNPGSIENVFDLTGLRVGGNGFMVLLQNSNKYVVNPGSTVVANENGPGFGSGSNSSVKHRGKNGQTSFQNASTTFFLIQANSAPPTGDDIDSDDDGLPDGEVFALWAVLDSVGVLDNSGIGDIAYGMVNFRRSDEPGANAMAVVGTVVSVPFTAGYVARVRNSTNWAAADWFAADELIGDAPRWRLVPTQSSPVNLGRGLLNNVGASNFRGAKAPGVLLRVLTAEVVEGGSPARYSLALNVPCRGGVVVEVNAPAGIEVSVDRGRTYSGSGTLKLTGTRPKVVLARQANDDRVGPWQRMVEISHTLVSSGDATRYSTDFTVMPTAVLSVQDDEKALLSELKVNPPGPDDGPFEFAELRGTPHALLEDVKLLVINGDADVNPGVVSVVDLSGHRMGGNGLLVIAGPGHPYLLESGTAVVIAPQLGQAAGGFPNGTITFLLVHTASEIIEGMDLDAGDNGKLEKLPADAAILDAISWMGGSAGGVRFTSAVIPLANGVPDAASRFSNDDRPVTAAAWFGGNLAGESGESLAYDPRRVTVNFPFGTELSPGSGNNTAPQVTAIPPFSGVIGDSTFPPIAFSLSDIETPVKALAVTVESSNPEVLPDSGIRLSGSGADRTLVVQPVGVGYATITIKVSDGRTESRWDIPFAASEDWRGGGRFHTAASDGSAAFAIDSRWMLVGDDENQRLRLYSRSNSGPPIALYDMNPFLGLKDFYDNGTPKEVDIEGVTHVGDRLYWLGSHSHAGDAEIRTNRARIFATDIQGKGTNITLTYAGRYEFLKHDLLNWDAHGEHGKPNFHYGLAESSAEGVDPKDTNGIGFNMEGLAMAPNSTTTGYLGFRAPLVPPTNRVHALIIPVTNFTTLAASEALPGAARFGAPIELNLGGRGIRSIEATGTNYLIVAGPPGVASGVPPSDFKLFTWSGNPADQPQQRSTEFPNLNVEAIVALPPLPWTSNSMVQLLCDNGVQIYYNDGIEAKHLPTREFKKFRTDWIRLGHVVTPQPFIRAAVKQEADAMTITWHSFAGVTYRVQSAESLAGADWVDLEGDVSATSATSVKSVRPSPERKFFRVIAIEEPGF